MAGASERKEGSGGGGRERREGGERGVEGRGGVRRRGVGQGEYRGVHLWSVLVCVCALLLTDRGLNNWRTQLARSGLLAAGFLIIV